jgi:hypothetical protein
MTFLISLVQGIVFLGFFLVHRRREKARGCHDLYEPRQNVKAHRSPPPFGGGASAAAAATGSSSSSSSSSWLGEAWALSDEETLRCVGLDTYMFLRLLRMGARVTFLGAFFACILIPVYFTGNATGPSTEGFNRLTLARVEDAGKRLWATLLAWCLFVGFVLHEFVAEWKLYAKNRYDYLAKGDPDAPMEVRYAVRVEQIPPQYRTDKALR